MQKWLICPTCAGNGKHSLRFGAITEADRAEWSDEEFSDYMRGDFAAPCDTCEASGKITAEGFAELETRRREFSETRWLPHA